MAAKTLILGASDNPARFANKAQHKLIAHGHPLLLVNPRYDEVEGLPCAPNLEVIDEAVDTVTVYVSPERLAQQLAQLIALHPRRVILNPGTESTDIEQALSDAGIEVVNHCTLILLDSGQY